MVTFYQVKPSRYSDKIMCFSCDRELMDRYAQELNGVVVEKVVG